MPSTNVRRSHTLYGCGLRYGSESVSVSVTRLSIIRDCLEFRASSLAFPCHGSAKDSWPLSEAFLIPPVLLVLLIAFLRFRHPGIVASALRVAKGNLLVAEANNFAVDQRDMYSPICCGDPVQNRRRFKFVLSELRAVTG